MSATKRKMFAYWNAQKIVSRNARFNFIIGGRSLGKTFDRKVAMTKKFIKHKRRFIYLRRYEPEFEDKDTFFSEPSFLEKFPKHEFKVDGMKGYVRKSSEDEDNEDSWELMCNFVILSKTYAKKSAKYDDVDDIIFDEFIIETGNIHYLKNEVTRFLDFYNTVDRFQDRVKVWFLANPISIINPYFLYFKLKPRKPTEGSSFTKSAKGLICLEVIKNEKFAAQVAKTDLGILTEGTAYFSYAIGGDFKDDTTQFIERKSSKSEYSYSFIFDGKQFGVWTDYDEGLYYICKKYPKNAKPFILTKGDLEPNLIMIERKSSLLKSLRRLYQYGYVYFDDIETRSIFFDVLDYLSIK